MILTLRERRLAASLRRRVDQEAARARQEGALREAAEALAGAFTVDEVTQRIANAALEAVEGRGAFVERIARPGREPSQILTVVATAGSGVPPMASACGFAGSYTEWVSAGGEPVLIPALGNPGRSGMVSTFVGNPVSALAVPLSFPGASVGTLFVISARNHFRAEDVARAAIFGNLAALAYEKVRLLDEAIEDRRKLERVMTSRSRLMRGFSHDVKNPIGAARSYTDLLMAGIYGDLNAEQQTSIERMRRCMHGALSLIDDLHELARAETGHLALSAEAVDLAELIRGIAEDYQASASSNGLSFTAAVAEDVPIIRSSRTRIRQITANLLSNAIKYTSAGSITVSAMRRSAGPDNQHGDWVAIVISDTGRGIAQEKLDFIFEEFARIGDSDKTGAGLGLAISRLLAQALGGHLTVTSELGQGSAFTLWLPSTTQPSG
jgi:signal transduction histidine kinase